MSGVLGVNGPPVAVCTGTRPEAVKLAPVVTALRRRGIPTVLLSSGQHRELLRDGLEPFGLQPDLDLALMRPQHHRATPAARAVEALDGALADLAPRAWR